MARGISKRATLVITVEYLPLCSGFMRGQEGEVPLTVSFKGFKPGYTEGALLVIVSTHTQSHPRTHIIHIPTHTPPTHTQVWSSGRISFTPLCFQYSLSSDAHFFPPEQLTPLTSIQRTPRLTRPALGVSVRANHTPFYSAELNSHWFIRTCTCYLFPCTIDM